LERNHQGGQVPQAAVAPEKTKEKEEEEEKEKGRRRSLC
jgi:hypothetical protein